MCWDSPYGPNNTEACTKASMPKSAVLRLYNWWLKPSEHHWYHLQSISDISEVRCAESKDTKRQHPHSHSLVTLQHIQIYVLQSSFTPLAVRLMNQSSTLQTEVAGHKNLTRHHMQYFLFNYSINCLNNRQNALYSIMYNCSPIIHQD